MKSYVKTMEIAGCVPPVEISSLSVVGEQRDTQRARSQRSSEMHRVYRTKFIRSRFFLHWRVEFITCVSFTMAIPTAIITGTIGYLVLAFLAVGGVYGSRATGMLSKDNAGIGNVVVGIAVFSMWLFWLCAWMHQWHPLIKPIYEG
jgi:V-type H+-transporting ATPase subunit e